MSEQKMSKKEEKWCPLSYDPNSPYGFNIKCQKEECAIYVEDYACSIKVIALSLRTMKGVC